jgi:phosphoribosyl-AMP cyclohydrolase
MKLNFDKWKGLVPAVAQDWKTGEVLMVAFMDPAAWEKTLATGKVHYHSRSRNRTWMKGEESGHVQIVKEILVDCDEDTVLIKVEQAGGAACHTGFEPALPAGRRGPREIIGVPSSTPRRCTGNEEATREGRRASRESKAP